jgi:cytochrome d ubiquinol oxidase subunit II
MILAVVMLAALILYALTGGADFGGGLWDLLATGPRAQEQRKLIENAIGPIWEANHVWLILVVVLLFSAFPPAYAAASVALHVPLLLMLIGIVMRGSAFVFRHHSPDSDRAQRRWGRVFAVASLITPIFLGMILGAITGGIDFAGELPAQGFFGEWLGAFPLCVGLFALALFAFLAAVYLTNECDGELREDFRRRALASGIAVGVCALLSGLFARAPHFRHFHLGGSWWSWPLQIATGLCALGGFATLWVRQFAAARLFAAAQVTLILVGWGAAQRPYLIPPRFTIENSIAPAETVTAITWALAVGAVTLFPSLIYLYRVFKRTSLR